MFEIRAKYRVAYDAQQRGAVCAKRAEAERGGSQVSRYERRNMLESKTSS